MAKLPPEREFAQQLDVNCTSLCKAIITLEVFGIIEVKHRRI
jgi:DNA-binding FadR family transcriptional regulator